MTVAGSAAPHVREQLTVLARGVVDLHSEDQLAQLLSAGRPLRIKVGFDPTRPDLHLGHTVVMRKMRQFQDLGHEVIFVVGDFTAQIGDPSGRNATRLPATKEQILEGAKTYAEQAFKVLDSSKTRVVYNSEWLGAMRFDDVIRLAGKYTLARMMERDDFKTRWTEHASISLHELLYPLAQAYDSVHLDCDVELGGTDQLFNLLVGREIMREHGQRPQVVMTLPILEGLGARVVDGKLVGDKMSKSLDNYVGVAEAPDAQFGKLMSISDELMWRYFEVLSDRPEGDVAALRARVARGDEHPKSAKIALAKEIVARYHDDAMANAAADAWERQFSRKERPDVIPDHHVRADGGAIPLFKALALVGAAKSGNEARTLIQGKSVYVDDARIDDVAHALEAGRAYVVRARSRTWVRITVERG